MFKRFREVYWKRDLIKSVIIIKIAVMLGLAATYFLPQEHAWMAGMSANLLWLWRT